MPRRTVVFVIFAVAAAVLFVRLGIWQLDRREQRRALNAVMGSRLDAATVDATRFLGDSTGARFRRARIAGAPDYAHEIVLAARSYNGSPGVFLFTPVHVAGRDTAMLVNRGWVYSPDGARVERSRWHDRDSSWTGYLELLPASGSPPGGGAVPRDTLVYRLDRDELARALPYPIAPVYLVAMEDSVAARRDTMSASNRVARLSPPPLDEGPHLSYALQWFAFAIIALVGAGVVVRRRVGTEPRPLHRR